MTERTQEARHKKQDIRIMIVGISDVGRWMSDVGMDRSERGQARSEGIVH